MAISGIFLRHSIFLMSVMGVCKRVENRLVNGQSINSNFSQFYCNIHKRCSSSSMVLSTIYIAVISSVTQVLPPMCVLAWSIACYSQDLHAARTHRFTDRFGQKFPLSLAMSVCESCELRSRMCGCRMRSIT